MSENEEKKQEQILQIENKLRGYTIRLFSYVDTILTRFLIFWMAKNPHETQLKLRNLKFHEKLKKGRKLIRDHYPSLLEDSTILFDKIEEYSCVRNQMAHCLFKWPYDNLEHFDIWDYIVDTEGNLELHSIVPTKTSVVDTFNKIKEINETVIEFIKFGMKVDNLVRPDFPELVPEFPEDT